MDGIKQLLDLQGVGAGYISDQLEYIHFSDIAYLSALSACSYDLDNEVTINEANIEQYVTPRVRFTPEKFSLNYYDQSFAITILTSTSTSTKAKASNNVNELSLVWGIYSKLKTILEANVAVKKSSEVQGYQYQGVPCSGCIISFEGLDTGYHPSYIELITSEYFLFGRTSHERTSGEQLLSIPYLTYKKRSVKRDLAIHLEKLLTYGYKLLALKDQLYRSNSEGKFGVNDRNKLVR